MKPKTLTYGVAAILMLAVPVALVVLPLSWAAAGPVGTEHVGGKLYMGRLSWDAGALGSSGHTLVFFEKPSFPPFVERRLQRVVFGDTKCQSNKAFAELQPDGEHVLVRCPWYDSDRPGTHDFLIPLY